MKDPWKQFDRRDGRAGRLRLWLASAGSLVAGAVLVGTLAAALSGLSAADRSTTPTSAAAEAEVVALRRELDNARGELDLANVRIERMSAIARYSSLYDVPADLSEAIYDIAIAEGIHPSLGFQLVKVESGFKPSARSGRGAIGYTQLRLNTARIYNPKLSERDLENRDINLRIGFRFLKDMLAQFDEDLNIALVAYNRGPSRVVDLINRGENPANGYAESVLRGIKKGS